jgi:AraC-like DNA-binding protein
MHARSIRQQPVALKRSPGELVAKGRIRVATLIPVPGLLQVGVAADRVGVSARTLSRRLAAEGTTFLRLREEACRSLAVQLLERTHMPASEIANQLGYSNPSAFTRAFQRWTGLGPAEWRASRRRCSTLSGHPALLAGCSESTTAYPRDPAIAVNVSPRAHGFPRPPVD